VTPGTSHTDFSRSVVALLGLPFDPVDIDRTVALLRTQMDERKPCLWVTPNVNFVATIATDAAFRQALLKADLSTVDGAPLLALARLLKLPLTQRVAGSDVFQALCRPRPDGRQNTVFLFGGPDGAAEQAHNALNRQAGGMRSVGWSSPGMGTVEDLSRPEQLDRMARSGAEFLLVALGAVKGHQWMDRNREAAGIPILSHLGAVVNFVAGTSRRAPRRLQRLGLEWLWRSLTEEGLWKRYARDGLVLLRECASALLPLAWKLRQWRTALSDARQGQWTLQAQGASTHITLSGVVGRLQLPDARRQLQRLNQRPAPVSIDIDRLTGLDCEAMGLLLLVVGHQIKTGQPVHFLPCRPEARRVLRWHSSAGLLSLV